MLDDDAIVAANLLILCSDLFVNDFNDLRSEVIVAAKLLISLVNTQLRFLN